MRHGTFGAEARRHKEEGTITTLFTVGVVLCMVMSFFTEAATFVFLGVMVLAVFFLDKLGDHFIVLFPLALLNPKIRVGAGGVEVTDQRTFYPLQVNMTEIFIAAILLAWLIRGRNRQGERAGRILNVPILILMPLAVMGVVFAISKTTGVKIAAEKVIEPMILLFVMTHIRWDRQKLRRALGVFIAVAVFVAVKSMIDWNLHPVDPEEEVAAAGSPDRLKSYWAATNVVGAFFTLAAPAAFLRSFYSRTIKGKLASWVAVGVLLYGLALTGSRTGWIAMGVVMVWLARRFRRTTVVLLLVAVAVGAYGTADMLKRGRSLADPMGDVSFQHRLQVWTDSIAMFAEKPLQGIGFGTFEEVYRSPVEQAHPHNDLLYLALEMGILAPIMVIIIVVRTFGSLRRATRLTTDQEDRIMLAALGGAIIAASLQCQMAAHLAWGSFSLAFWYTVGLAVAYSRSIILDREDQLAAAAPALPRSSRPENRRRLMANP